MNIDHATSLLSPGETAVALLTRGPHLDIRPDGSGSSGNWKITPRDFDKVIIYHELPGPDRPRADIYLADYVDTVTSSDPGRHVVRFQRCSQVGTTTRKWSDFADAGQNPVRYLQA
jgi:hypothetical protein